MTVSRANTHAELIRRTIAVVEDDQDFRLNLCRFLEKSGFDVWGTDSAENFYVSLLQKKADLVLVDLGLPGEDGLTLIERLAALQIPVVALTGTGDVCSRISGFNAGALQYFVKPADLNELVAGINSQLRYLHSPKLEDGRSGPMLDWRLDTSESMLFAPNRSKSRLTSRELDLLRCLMSARGNLFSKQDLLDAMGYSNVEGGYHRIEALLARLRSKTTRDTGMALPVRAIFGRGLVFVE